MKWIRRSGLVTDKGFFDWPIFFRGKKNTKSILKQYPQAYIDVLHNCCAMQIPLCITVGLYVPCINSPRLRPSFICIFSTCGFSVLGFVDSVLKKADIINRKALNIEFRYWNGSSFYFRHLRFHHWFLSQSAASDVGSELDSRSRLLLSISLAVRSSAPGQLASN